jgi:hypothetical protein
MRFHNLLRDAQAQAGAVRLSVAGVGAAKEWVEDPVSLFASDAGASVGDADLD